MATHLGFLKGFGFLSVQPTAFKATEKGKKLLSLWGGKHGLFLVRLLLLVGFREGS